MATKDHSLDEKIIQAATSEFLEYGFQRASLRRIAQRAELSTGELYTRYENKDALFCSIAGSILSDIASEFQPVQQSYMDAQQSYSVDAVLEAIREEERAAQRILLNHYDECVLLYCKSEGSSLQQKMEHMLTYTVTEIVKHLKAIARHEVNVDGIAMILSEQFYCYRSILLRGLSKEKTIECLKLVEGFHEAGWKKIFEQIME